MMLIFCRSNGVSRRISSLQMSRVGFDLYMIEHVIGVEHLDQVASAYVDFRFLNCTFPLFNSQYNAI